MKINTKCPGCMQTIYPYFYVDYFEDNRDDKFPSPPPVLGSFLPTPIFPKAHLFITYYDSSKQKFIAGQMYHLSCFCASTAANPAWQLCSPPNSIRQREKDTISAL